MWWKPEAQRDPFAREQSSMVLRTAALADPHLRGGGAKDSDRGGDETVGDCANLAHVPPALEEADPVENHLALREAGPVVLLQVFRNREGR